MLADGLERASEGISFGDELGRLECQRVGAAGENVAPDRCRENSRGTHCVVKVGAEDKVGNETGDGDEERGEGARSNTEVQTQESSDV